VIADPIACKILAYMGKIANTSLPGRKVGHSAFFSITKHFTNDQLVLDVILIKRMRFYLKLFGLLISKTEELSGVVQVPLRCPVRSGAGTPQVPCQEWCRNRPTESLTQHFPEFVLGDFLLVLACPMDDGTLCRAFLILS